MSSLCLRCDWTGEDGGTACPRCGAPLYRPVTSARPRRAAAQRPEPATGEPERSAEAAPFVAPRAPTSLRAVAAIVVVAFAVIAVAMSTSPDEPRRVAAPSSSPAASVDGILVYAAADGSGAARLWLWDLSGGDVTRGPLVPKPLEIVAVRSPGYGWIAFTADVGNGAQVVSVLDSLEPGAAAEPVGNGDLVAWAREGGTAILVEREPLQDGCRRPVAITAVNLDIDGGESVLDDTICGDVLGVGRTSLGYFLTTERPGGADVVADVVGTGYDDAGVLLADHGAIAIAPSGAMLVTPSSEFLPVSDRRVPIAGDAWYFRLFGGRPEPYVVDGSPLRVERVLAFAPGSILALAIGSLPGEDPGLWELPLGRARGARTPRFVGVVDGATSAAYAADGTAFVVTDGGLWAIRDHRMERLALPEGAPRPAGPLVWIAREPLTEL
jgi:hypothetical protein